MSEQDDTPAAASDAGIGGAPSPGTSDAAGAELTPEQQAEMQQRLEEQLRQIRVQDVVAESAVSIINLTARRIGKEDERDLEQARVGIEAVRALSELVEGELQTQLRTALSEIQMMYARESGGAAPGAGQPEPSPSAQPQQPGTPDQPGAGGQQGGEPPSRLWTPGR